MALSSASFAVNAAALVGWTAVMILTTLSFFYTARPSSQILNFTLVCELICISEIVKIALGWLRGDILLGITVHYTRMLMLLAVIPESAVTALNVKTILIAWSVTEVGRYPMVLFPDVPALRTFRYAVPLITFPLGAGSEAWAAYQVLSVTANQILYYVLWLVVIVNVTGGVVWYPSMMMKVVKSLAGENGDRKSDKKETKPTRRGSKKE